MKLRPATIGLAIVAGALMMASSSPRLQPGSDIDGKAKLLTLGPIPQAESAPAAQLGGVSKPEATEPASPPPRATKPRPLASPARATSSIGPGELTVSLQASVQNPQPGDSIVIEAFITNNSLGDQLLSGYNIAVDCAMTLEAGATGTVDAVTLDAPAPPGIDCTGIPIESQCDPGICVETVQCVPPFLLCPGGEDCLDDAGVIVPDFSGAGLCEDLGKCSGVPFVDGGRVDSLLGGTAGDFSDTDCGDNVMKAVGVLLGGSSNIAVGETKYLGTFLFDVSGDASGTFTLPILPSSTLADDVPVIIDPALIDFEGASIDIAVCSLCSGNECESSPSNCHLNNRVANAGLTGRTSDLGSGFKVADSFVPTGSPITSVCFWGFYIDFGGPTDCGPGDGDSFTITIYDNNNGLPGSVISSETIPAPNLLKIASGGVSTGIGMVQQYSYSAFLALTVFPAQDECHWIEIVNDSPGSCLWLWSTAPPGDARGVQDQDSDGVYEYGEEIPHDLALCIDAGLSAGDCTGACCRASIGQCDNDVPYDQCANAGFEHSPGWQCASLDPACGTNACCDGSGSCTETLPTECGGTLFENVSCDQIICSVNDSCTLDNGEGDLSGTTVSSQRAPDIQFFAEGADDFILLGAGTNPCKIESIEVALNHFNHQGDPGAGTGCLPGGPNPGNCMDTPDDYASIRVTIYEDSGGPGGMPAEVPILCEDDTPCVEFGDVCDLKAGVCSGTLGNDGSHVGDVAYELIVPPGNFVSSPLGAPEDSQFEVTIDVASFDVVLDKNTRYWLSVAPELNFLDLYQTAWMTTQNSNGTPAQRIFSAAGITPWQELASGRDLAFELLGGKDCSVDPIDDCNFSGLHDSCDIANGTSDDCNHNGVPDECEGGPFARLYVNDDAPPGGTGASWATALVNLQDALPEAGTCLFLQEVWVAEGEYRPDQGAGRVAGNRLETFQLASGVAVRGGFAGTEATLQERVGLFDQTILTGDLEDDDGSGAGCSFENTCCTTNGTPGCEDTACQDAVCVIMPDCCNVAWDATCAAAALTECDNICTLASSCENSFHVVTVSGTDNTTIMDGFTITAGNANGSSPNDNGAGMVNDGGSPTVANCTFNANAAVNNGGGMHNNNSSPVVTGCTFSGNSAGYGGGMHNLTSSPTVTNCIFTGNSATDAGGGMANHENCFPAITNCTFISNTAMKGGGMTNESNSAPTVTNCTFTENSADFGGGMYNAGTFILTVTNCILWGDSSPIGPEIYVDSTSFLVVSFNDIQGGEALVFVEPGGVFLMGGGNIEDDPLFVDTDGQDDEIGTVDDNLRLSFGSPVIDVGNNGAVPPGVLTDLGGNNRFVDDPDSPNGGAGTPPIVDMGAFEYQPDCNDNNVSDDVDILAETSPDCNNNGIPDECEIDENSRADGGPFFCSADCAPDCNDSGVPDECELADNDCNANDIPDECDIDNCPPETPSCDDCNFNGDPDSCDLDGDDCNTNGVPDACELNPVTNCNSNGVLDECEAFDDCNANGIPDECEVGEMPGFAGVEIPDCNGNGIPDECEIDENSAAAGGPFFCSVGCAQDCNINGVPDECDIEITTSDDCNENDIPDECEPDCNANGIADGCDIQNCPPLTPACADCNANGIPDECEVAAPTGICTIDCEPDCNANSRPDACDIADMSSSDCESEPPPHNCCEVLPDPICNDQEIVDCACEFDDFCCGADTWNQDCVDAVELAACGSCGGGNGIPDECEPDCDNDGITDACEIFNCPPATTSCDDCNGNGVPDGCEIPVPLGTCAVDCDDDCNGNAIPDSCDDGIVECQPADRLLCDCDNDGVLDTCAIALDGGLDLDDNGFLDTCIEFTGEGENLEGASQSWNIAGNWFPVAVPNNTPEQQFNANIRNAGDIVVLTINAAVNTLIMGSTTQLNLTDIGDLTIATPDGILNNGSITVGSGRAIIAAAPFQLTGSSAVTLSGATASLSSATAGDTITNFSTIQGQGVIDADFANSALGFVQSNVFGGTLLIQGPNAKQNDGLFEASGEATLEISTSVSGFGRYRADGGEILFTSAGGAKAAAGPGSMMEGQFMEVTGACGSGTISEGAIVDIEEDAVIGGDDPGAGLGCQPPILTVEGDGVLQASTLTVANGGVVEMHDSATATISADLRVDSGGSFLGAAATLTAGSIQISGDELGTGTMNLQGGMEVSTTGSIDVFNFDAACAALELGCQPPVLNIMGSASISGGSMDVFSGGIVTLDQNGTVSVTGPLEIGSGGQVNTVLGSSTTIDAGSIQLSGSDAQMTLDGASTVTVMSSVGMSTNAPACLGFELGCQPPVLNIVGSSTFGSSSMEVANASLVLLGGTSTTTLSGALQLSSGATLQNAPGSTPQLNAGSVSIVSASDGGQLLAGPGMIVTIAGNLTIDGLACLPDPGGCNPPALHVDNGGELHVGGDLKLLGGAQISVQPQATFTLEGNFANEAVNPVAFDWAGGSLLMQGSSQILEAAGEDRAAVIAGFADNFAFGTLELAAGSSVLVVDAFDNQQDGLTACDEAVYVDVLILNPGAVLNTNDCRVYYRLLSNDGGSIPGLDTEVIQINCTVYGDVDGDGDTNLFDLICMLNALAGEFTCPGVTPQALDIFPCGGGSDLDVDDLMAMTDSLSGQPACPDVCP